MKCAICKNKTDWDSSFGYKDFIVCPKCFEIMHNKYGADKAMSIIFTLGKIAKENKKGVDI